MKTCSTCSMDFDDILFKKDGYDCKSCRRLASTKKYREKNREKLKTLSKKYKEENKEKVKISRQKFFDDNPNYLKGWVSKNRERSNLIKKKHEDSKKKNNEIYKMTRLVRNSIRSSIRSLNYKKKTKTSDIIGCSMEYFIIYIQSTFLEGMTLENYGEWHLDHKKPISMAKSYEEAILLNHYSNFQALWALDNLKKYNKYGY